MFFKKKVKAPIEKGMNIRFWIALVFLIAGIFSILQLFGIFIPVQIPGEYLLWVTSIGCLLFGIMAMFKRKI